MSVAGKRAGLDGSRSNLFYQAIRIIKEMREKTNGKYPKYGIFENVPGAFSSNKGEDFRRVLEEFCQVKMPEAHVPPAQKWYDAGLILGGDFSVAWRVLDAQYWSVPQRRRRIYLVADFTGERAGEILFVSESVLGNPAAGRSPWKRAAGDFAQGVGTAGIGRVTETVCLTDQGGERMDVSPDVTGTLRAETHGHAPVVMDEPKACGFCTEHSARSRSIGYEEECSPTLRAGVVPATVALDNHPMDSRLSIEKDGKIQTLSKRMGDGGNNVPLLMQEEIVPVTLKIRSGKPGGGKGPQWAEDLSATLGCNNDQTLFVPEKKPQPCAWDGGQISGTLTRQNAGGSQRMPDKDNFNCVLEPVEGENSGQPEQEPPETRDPEQKAFGISSYTSHAMLSDNPHSGIYEAQTSRTLDLNGGAPTCNQGGIAIVGKENAVPFTCNQRDEVRALGEKAGCLSAEPGMKQQTFVLQGSMIGRADKNGPQGSGVNEDVSFSLTSTDRHAICAPESNEGVYGMTTGSFMKAYHEQTPTLMARDYKDPTTVAPVPADPVYTVRRLTPVECARLQALPDWWCDDLGTENPTDEEIAFWKDVFEIHRKVVTHTSKPKTEKQIRKWLADPYSDNAAYRMYGNGICVNCAVFVLAGIVWADGLDADVIKEK